jgi:NRPS condensation-like uncharacterized protein
LLHVVEAVPSIGQAWPLNGFDAALVAQTYDGRPMTTHHVLDIDRPLDVEHVRRATEQLVAIYPELCSRIELAPKLRRFLAPPDRARVRRSVQVDDDGSVAALERWMARPIAIERDYPFAIRLAPGGCAAQSITLTLHHSLTDGHGALGVFDALLRLLQSQRPRARAIMPAANLRVPVRQPWSHAMRRIAMLCRPAAALVDDVDPNASGPALMLVPIPRDTWRTVGRRARRHGATRTTVLWHSAARAVSEVREQDSPVRIMSPVDLRPALGVPRDALQNWLGTIEHDVDPDDDIRDLHAELCRHREESRVLATPLVLSTLTNALPPRLATAVFRLVDSDRWPTTHTLMLTHLRPSPTLCWPSELAPRRLWCTSLLPRKPAIGLTITSVGDVVTIAASWRAADLRRPTVEAFLARWLAILAEGDA